MSLRSLSFGLALASANAANYAVITAGSKYYSNYRHQADACHAYQVLRAKGIPAANIVMMMYDDVAQDLSNPFPGKLFNKPSEGEGVDVYAGCEIDYRGDDVTPENFLAVLTGTASGRKLESTEEDNVFVYFVDHGAPGLIAFPQSELHKSELQSTLQAMSDAKMFKKLVFYLETCESGSMFEDMNIPNVYAVSAANPTESSWGTYCGLDAKVNGQSIGSCLGDLFSVSWLEDSEAQDITMESLDDQYSSLTTRVIKSHVLQWGDTSFTSDPVGDFIGSTGAKVESTSSPEDSTVNTRHIDLTRLYVQYQAEASSETRLSLGQEMYHELNEQLNAEVVYRRLVEIAYPDSEEEQERVSNAMNKPDNMECEKSGHQTIRNECAELFDANSGFALHFHQQMVNLCHDIASGVLVLDIDFAARTACHDVSSNGLAMSGLIV